MKNKITILQLLFVLFFYAPLIHAQKTVDQIFTKSNTRIISLNHENLATKSTQFNQSIDLGEYGIYQLSLEQTYLFSDSYVAKNKDNSKLPLTFKGTIQGQPNTRVSLTTNDGFLSGFIDTGEEVIFFEPHKNFDTNAVENELIVYYQKDVIDQEHSCAANHTDQQGEQLESQNDQFKSMNTGCYVVQMALVADHGMFQKHGANTLTHITSVLNNVKANYDTEFNDEIEFTIVANYIAETSGEDLWTTTANASDLLNEFKNSNFTTNTYDLASLWVTRDIWGTNDDGTTNFGVVGVAKTSGLCGNRYNLIEDYTASAASLRVVFAHEIGHNFSASHDAVSGNIMAENVNITDTWSTQSQNQINAFYPDVGCLCVSEDRADLIFRSCGTSSMSGNALTISGVQVKNAGSISAGVVKVGWYLSTNNNITTSDFLIKTENTSILNPRFYNTFNTFTEDLSNIPSGNYYLGTIIDYEEVLTEFNEDNNIGCISPSANITIAGTPPDLQISSCGTSFSSNGITFYSNVTVQNSGTDNANASTLGVYLSTNSTITTSDYLVETVSVPALSGGATSSLSFNFDPAAVTGVPGGNYYIGFLADANSNVTESDENNNTDCVSPSASITIVGPTCVTDYTVPANHTSNEHIEVSNQITSQKVVPNGLTVSYDAGVKVLLQDGFHAQPGSIFHAYIEGCTANKGETVDNELILFRNYPNPFTGHTTIEFTLSKDTPVTLSVSDVTGKQITVLLNNEIKAEGTHLRTFDGSKYAAGMYYYTIQAGEYTATQKMILIK